MKLPYKVDKEFKSYLPKLDDEDRAGLKESIAQIGLTESLVVWKETGILLDGHNRSELAIDCGKPTPIKHVSLPDREAALSWIRRHARSRRNMTPEQRAYYLGEEYNYRKSPHGGERGASAQNGHLLKTSEKIAEEHGVGANTVKRAGEFAEALNKLSEDAPDLKETVLAGESNASMADITKAVLLPVKKRKKAAKKIAEGKKPEIEPQHKSGKLKSDPRSFKGVCDCLGKSARLIDALNRSHPAAKFHRDALHHLNLCLVSVREWQQALR